MRTMGSLDGQVCLVAGASRGVGKGCALELGAAGATVYVTGRTAGDHRHPLPGTVAATAAEVSAAGGIGISVGCDHRDDRAVEDVFHQIAEEHGRIDVVVNSAFIIPDELTSGRPFWDVPLSNWDDMVGVGTRSAYVTSALAARPMVAAGRGLIVNISSSGAIEYAWSVAYGVGKCALDRLTADTAHELAPHGVSVVSLWPGFVRTERIDMAVKAGLVPAGLDVSRAESPRFTGRAAAALASASDTERARWSGRAVASRDLADHFAFTDVDGRLPDGPLHDRKA